jgi:hypothetical protein
LSLGYSTTEEEYVEVAEATKETLEMDIFNGILITYGIFMDTI